MCTLKYLRLDQDEGISVTEEIFSGGVGPVGRWWQGNRQAAISSPRSRAQAIEAEFAAVKKGDLAPTLVDILQLDALAKLPDNAKIVAPFESTRPTRRQANTRQHPRRPPDRRPLRTPRERTHTPATAARPPPAGCPRAT